MLGSVAHISEKRGGAGNAMPSCAYVCLWAPAPFPSVVGKAEGGHTNTLLSLGTHHVVIKTKRETAF